MNKMMLMKHQMVISRCLPGCAWRCAGQFSAVVTTDGRAEPSGRTGVCMAWVSRWAEAGEEHLQQCLCRPLLFPWVSSSGAREEKSSPSSSAAGPSSAQRSPLGSASGGTHSHSAEVCTFHLHSWGRNHSCENTWPQQTQATLQATRLYLASVLSVLHEPRFPSARPT